MSGETPSQGFFAVQPEPLPPRGGPRAAFVELTAGAASSAAARHTSVALRTLQRPNVGRASLVSACALEAAVVVPTLHVEAMLAEEPWSVLLRVVIAVVRLFPILSPCAPLAEKWFVRCAASFFGSAYTRWRRIAIFLGSILGIFFCPEVRWGLAITLDMWYLLTTPLNKGLSETPFVILLVANILLCFLDTLTLIMMLAVKTSEEFPMPDVAPEGALRPRPVKVGALSDLGEEQAEGKYDPTCVICLSDLGLDDNVVQLPCEHAFHEECISRWLERSRRCPLRCPQVVFPPLASPSPPEEEDILLPSQAPAPAAEEDTLGL